VVRIAVLVSAGGTNLQALLDSQKDGRLRSGRVQLVIADRDHIKALHRADKAGVASLVIKKQDYPSASDFGEALIAALTTANIGLVVLAGYLTVVPENVIHAFAQRIINIHPALIPAFSGRGYYGLKVHHAVLAYGAKVSGATVHFVDTSIDGGPIIMQKAVIVPEAISAEELQQLIMRQAEWQILPQAVEACCAGRVRVDGRRVMISEEV
jgi:phosphoribosylglycinamide formyltransferase-1